MCKLFRNTCAGCLVLQLIGRRQMAGDRQEARQVIGRSRSRSRSRSRGRWWAVAGGRGHKDFTGEMDTDIVRLL